MTLFANQFFNGAMDVGFGSGQNFQGTELRCGVSYVSSSALLCGSGQWGAASGQGPLGNGQGGQIYGIYGIGGIPYSGSNPYIECQLPVYQSAVESMAVGYFGTNGYKVLAGVSNAHGYGTVWTRQDATRSWQETTVWQSPVTSPVPNVQVRSLFVYQDSSNSTYYAFAGVDDGQGNGGVFRGVFDTNASGNIIWNSTPELLISSTNTGTLPTGINIRVMSFASGYNGTGTSLFCTIGIEVWQRTDSGTTSTWSKVWSKPVRTGENSNSGLRGLTKLGNYFLVFPEGTDWGVMLLTPGATWAAAWQYDLGGFNTGGYSAGNNLQYAFDNNVATGYTITYVIGAYNGMDTLTISSTNYGLIGIGIAVSAFPAGAQVWQPGGTGTTAYIGKSYFIVRNGSTYTLRTTCQQQSNPTTAIRFMVPINSSPNQFTFAGGFDYETLTNVPQYGWGAYEQSTYVP